MVVSIHTRLAVGLCSKCVSILSIKMSARIYIVYELLHNLPTSKRDNNTHIMTPYYYLSPLNALRKSQSTVLRTSIL